MLYIMKFTLAVLVVMFFSACSTKEVVKNPEMLSLSNVTMSYIVGNDFVMGTYKDFFKDKAPREVRVYNFYIDKTEVTNAAYKQYIDEAGKSVIRPRYIDDLGWGLDTFPVVGVTHKDAQNFCKFYGKRLPTEAEWEFAARGGKNFLEYPWGDNESADFMNFRGSNNSWAVDVASYPPNSYGLFDMSGNVREWVEDSYEKDFYIRACTLSPLHFKSALGSFTNSVKNAAQLPVKLDSITGVITNPLSTAYKSNCYLDPINTADTKYKSNRGGSWEYSEGYPATVSFRFFDEADSSYKDLGFRCAADAQKSSWIEYKYGTVIDTAFGTIENPNSPLMDESRKKAQELKNSGSLIE